MVILLCWFSLLAPCCLPMLFFFSTFKHLFSFTIRGVLLITCPGRDLGFLYWMADASRCKRLLGSVEVIFMVEAVLFVSSYYLCFACASASPAFLVSFFPSFWSLSMQPWTATIYFISRSKWKLRRMQSASCAELRNGHLLHLRYPFVVIATHNNLCFGFHLELIWYWFLCPMTTNFLLRSCMYILVYDQSHLIFLMVLENCESRSDCELIMGDVQRYGVGLTKIFEQTT